MRSQHTNHSVSSLNLNDVVRTAASGTAPRRSMGSMDKDCQGGADGHYEAGLTTRSPPRAPHGARPSPVIRGWRAVEARRGEDERTGLSSPDSGPGWS